MKPTRLSTLWLIGDEGYDHYSITFENGRWQVFYSEVGERWDGESYDEEQDACAELYRRALKTHGSMSA